MQQKQRPTAKNAKLTFGVRRTERHRSSPSRNWYSGTLCESGLRVVHFGCCTYGASTLPTPELPPLRSHSPFNPDCSRSQVTAGDFVALDAWHINMLSRLPDCSVVLGWVRSNSGWGRVTAGRGEGCRIRCAHTGSSSAAAVRTRCTVVRCSWKSRNVSNWFKLNFYNILCRTINYLLFIYDLRKFLSNNYDYFTIKRYFSYY